MPRTVICLRKLMPPPVALIAAAALMALTHYRVGLTVDIPGRVLVAGLLALAGIGLAVAAIRPFRRDRTTANPLAPERASSLVTDGPYRYTRNPMYWADIFLLLGWAVYLASPLALVWIALFALWIDRIQIPAEECALEAHFGTEYADYCARVGRWL